MDFSDTTQEAGFRAEAAAWLKDNVPAADELEGLVQLSARRHQHPEAHPPAPRRATVRISRFLYESDHCPH